MPRLIDHEQRRSDIIDVTWNLIVRGGIESATMREIAAEAGFANGALKHYFSSKDKIVESTFDRAMRMVEAHPEATVAATGLAGLRAMCMAIMPLDAERIEAGRVLLAFWEMALSNEELHEDYVAHLTLWRERMRARIEEGRADGDIVTATPDDQLIDEMVLLTSGANIMTLVGSSYTTIELLKTHLDAFFDRLVQPAVQSAVQSNESGAQVPRLAQAK